MQKQIHKMIFTLALFALCIAGLSRFVTRPVAGQTQTLHSAAALNQLKQDGLNYSTLIPVVTKSIQEQAWAT